MLFRIQKSLGKVSAVSIDTIWKQGVCIDFQKFGDDDASIVIYQGGRLEDSLKLNGWSFPCVYNGLRRLGGDDIYGGRHYHFLSFEALDPNGSLQMIEQKYIYGEKEAIAVEYFYSMLYNLSCCKDIIQFAKLYEYIIDNKELIRLHERLLDGSIDCISISEHKKVSGALHFIELFRPRLDSIENGIFVSGLKHRIDYTYKAVLGIMASPIYNQD